ncbi:1-acyl-sn-glycerol-3-phosphate acyltransferase [Streptomyces sp. 6N223]|uniref:1-acyl-sn-glycerol-3-phosphate acyltransferase n=1 Tax=Streptomyces sp. 6N223 TaxID=3457412 RepID=UPI003FD59CC4
MLRATGGLRVEGPVPGGPCVVVANHASHADTAALLAALPARRRPLVAAAADYWFGRPLRAAVCRGLAAGFPVRRGSEGGRGFTDLAAAARLLAAGHTVVVFPEGTRSRDGTVGRFRSGATRLAELADVPLVPAGLVGTDRLLPAHGRLRRAAVTVRFGEPTRDPAAAYREVCRLAERQAQAEEANERAGTHEQHRDDGQRDKERQEKRQGKRQGKGRQGKARKPGKQGRQGRQGKEDERARVGVDAGAAGHRGAHQRGDTHRLPARLRQWLDA